MKLSEYFDNFTSLTAELQAELQARKKQYEYYRDELLKPQEKIPMVTLGEIGRVRMCKRILKEQTNSIGDVPFYKIGTFGKKADAFITQELFEEYKKKYSYPEKGDILISCSGTIGRTIIFDGKPSYFQDSNIVWLEHDETKVLNKYLMYCYSKQPWKISTGGTISRLYNDNILKAKIPAPSLNVQKRLVEVLDNFEKICSDLNIGLPAEIEARQKQYEYYRDALLSFDNSYFVNVERERERERERE
ncbi:restriction endonuclease subunit S, partial [Ruminococcus sp. AF17-24]